MTKRDLEIIARAGGLRVEGKESIAELAEAITYLVQRKR